MAIWYAQTGSRAVSDWSGSASTVWFDAAAGGNAMTGASFAAVLGATDILVANAQTALLMDATYTCGTIQTSGTANGASGSNGGGFTFNGTAAKTFTMNILAGTTACLSCVTNSTNRTAVVGNITGGSSSSAYGFYMSSSYEAKVDVTGNVTGGSNSTAYGVYCTGNNGQPTVTGNITGATAIGFNLGTSTSDTLTVTNGVITGGATAPAVGSPGLSEPGIILIMAGSTSLVFSTAWVPPFSRVKLKWVNSDTKERSITVYDTAGGSRVLYVPNYPGIADVKSGTTFDYTTKTGTYAGGAQIGAFENGAWR